MNIQPIDLPSLLRAFLWPLLIVIVAIVYRRSLVKFISAIGQQVHRFSLGWFSVELAQVSEIKPMALETEIRNLDAGLYPQSGSTAISNLLMQLRQERQHDYIVIDLGSTSSPNWITSRLYLLAFLLALVDRPLCFVFVETVGDIRKRFIGNTAADRVRWALARRYTWLESASASAYASLGDLQFDPATGALSDWQVTQMMQNFLSSIRLNPAPATPVPSDPIMSSPVSTAPIPPDPALSSPVPVTPSPPAPAIDMKNWVVLNDEVWEHAKWVDGPRIERTLGNDLNRSRVLLPPDKLINDLTRVLVGQQGRFVAIVEPDLTFRELVDRYAVLENLAHEFLKQTSPSSMKISGEG